MENEKKKKIWSILKEVSIYAAIIVTGVFLIPNYVMAKNVINGESMENTLYNEEQILTEMVSVW